MHFDLGSFGHIAFTPEFFSALLSIILINLILSGDNAVVIALAVNRLPGPARRMALYAAHLSVLAFLLLGIVTFVAEVRAQTGTAPAATAPAAVVPVRTTAKWLVDLGRDYPFTPQASVSDADAELIEGDAVTYAALILLLIGQRHIVRGLTIGAIK